MTTESIEIETGVPMPESKGVGRRLRYPLLEMEVGQSFFAPGRNAAQMSAYTGYVRRKYGKSFQARTLAENGVDGCRVWRIE